MRIQIFKKSQDHTAEQPAHRISPSFLAKMQATVPLIDLGNGMYKLNTPESFDEIKARFRPTVARKPIKLAVRDWRECLLLSYPLADQRSNPAY